MIPLAHGVGTRADLPLPVNYVVIGGGVALVASFTALGVLWRTPRFRGGAAGSPVPRWLATTIDSRLTTGLLRLVVLALTVFVFVVAFLGPRTTPRNLAPWVLYVTFWVGLVPVSLLLGPVWARLNPLRTIHAAMSRVTGPPLIADRLPRLGYYPAAAVLLVFAWLELAAPSRSDPRVIAVFLASYASAQLFGALLFGAGWFARGDAFEVYSRLLGRLSVLGRRDDGRLVWRSPFNGAAALPAERGVWSVVVTLVGSTAFDGVTRTTWWQNSRYGSEGGWAPPTVGLVLTVLAVAGLYLGGSALAGRMAGVSSTADRYAHSLIPIAAGYAVAHYFSLLLIDGQTTYILASDPFDHDRNIFGTAKHVIDYTLLSPRLISLVQVFAIVIGHILGLVLAHDRALRLDQEGSRPHTPWVAQLPLLTVMVCLTCAGLTLLLGT